MRTLFLDLASHEGLLACVDGDTTVSATKVSNRISDAELLPFVEQTIKDASWEMAQIERIACVTGPGGFTSQRVAVTLGNTLAWGLHIPIAGIHLGDLYFARMPSPQPSPTRGGSDVIWIHSTKKTLVFVRGFGKFAEQWPEATPVELTTLILPKGASFIGEILPEHEEQFLKQGAQKLVVTPLEEVLPAFLSTLFFDQKPLEPWYGRGF